MEILEGQNGAVGILGLKGRLDAGAADIFSAKIGAVLAAGGRRIALDCTNLEYVSSAGLRVLFAAAKKIADTGGRLNCCCVTPFVRKTFDLVGLEDDLPIFATPEEAVRDLSA